ncbi:DNA translocase FtsK [Pseudoflavonifractor sp. MSJ-37]|uniref:FtsK/SpoIIIE family DNA translocase n=1 Tax=Pseudoflavonifractor sp. MSJ-37 TaxID=2841531 RepID=UPI0020A09C23|nr:DNA translocase FtsK [Pseudoflavonifractor sp. MSJ-37]
MATAPKKTSGGKRSASSSGKRTASSGTSRTRSGGGGSRKKPSAPAPRPFRREVGALVCLLLAVFAALGYFHVQALFIDFFGKLAKGLIGYGYYLLPPALLGASGILAFHRGRPVRLRVWCVLLLPVLFGALLHLFLAKGPFAWNASLLKDLWAQGEAVQCGGALSGLIAMALQTVFSKAGACVVFVIGGAALGMGALHVTPADIADYLRDRPEYEEEELPPRRSREQAHARRERGRTSDIDIPVDDGPLVGKEPPNDPIFQRKGKFFNKKPSVPTPDQILTGEGRAEPSEHTVPGMSKPEPVTVPEPEKAVQEPPVRPSEPVVEPEEEHAAPATEEPKPPFGLFRAAPEPSVREEPHPAPEPEDLAGPEPFPPEEPEPVRPSMPPMPPVPEIQREPAVGQPQSKAARAEEQARAAAEMSQAIEQGMAAGNEGEQYQYPPIDLLDQSSGISAGDVAGELRSNQMELASTIQSFGIDATIVDAVRGPSVTRYELELAQGVRMNKLTNLTDDIALALGATGVRIAAIPDKKSMVGIEVPNKLVAPVGIRDVIDSREFRESPSKVSFAVGKDISNRCVVCNIGKLPHLLIAGTTGSGKSVCTNSLIVSLLYKATPEEVRLIMVDPKMVELGIYNGIPHLLIPVVTDPKKAAGALQWAVVEMMKRYKAFSEVGTRDLKSYNALAERTEGMKKMPSVVVVIDELADLMLVAAKEVEESICRVAQMGRAAGMHLIIATQRPSADVITGLMKANIPSRIAFAVQSSLDSRIILDNTGAEKLVGRGDMLYFPLGSGKPQRIQGCFISDEEVARVVEFVKRSGTADYDEEVLHQIEQNAAAKDKSGKNSGGADMPDDSDSEEYDELLPNAIEVVVESGMASVSMLQRRLKLGYSRAARLVDQMEEKGVVGPFEGSKPRQVLISKAQWQEMKYRQNMPAGAPPLADEPVPEELEFERDAIEQGPPPFDMDDC